MTKRLFDILIAALLGVLLIVPAIIIATLVKFTSKGPAIHWSARVGRNNKIFQMPKFRSMLVSSPEVATHLLNDPNRHITKFGRFIRKTSLDEIPQIWSVLLGHMSLVGPRPALFNQSDLIQQRTDLGIHLLRPGITGLAQISGRDELTIPDKVDLDSRYMANNNIYEDIKILGITAVKIIKPRGISH